MFDLNVFEIIGIAAVFLGAIFMLVWLFYSFQSARISFGAWQRRRKTERATREAAARIAPNINVTVMGLNDLSEALKTTGATTRALIETLGRPRFHDGGVIPTLRRGDTRCFSNLYGKAVVTPMISADNLVARLDFEHVTLRDNSSPLAARHSREDMVRRLRMKIVGKSEEYFYRWSDEGRELYAREQIAPVRQTYPHACRANFNFGTRDFAIEGHVPGKITDFRVTGFRPYSSTRLAMLRELANCVPDRIARELKLFDPKWARPTKTGPTLTEMELAVRTLRRMRWVIRQQREEIVASRTSDKGLDSRDEALGNLQRHADNLQAQIVRLEAANVELAAGASAKSLPPRLPALYTTWVCAKAPEIGDPPTALENAVGTSWRVDGLRRVEDPSYHVVTLVGLSEGFNATSLHVPLEMFRSHFSRPDTAHKDS